MAARSNISRKRFVEDISASEWEQDMFGHCVQLFAQSNGINYQTAFRRLTPYFNEALNLGLIGSDACDYAVRHYTRDAQHMFLNPVARKFVPPTPYFRELW